MTFNYRPFAATLAALILFSGLCAGQSDTLAKKERHFSASGQLWSRAEMRRGSLPTPDPTKDYAVFLMGSSILRLDYTSPWLDVRFAPLFFGVWGSNSSGNLAIDEAWFKLKYKNVYAQLGRQKLMYDDQRIIGADDWVMATATHDVLKLAFENKMHKLHLLVAFNQNNDNINGGTYYMDGGQPYKTMQTLWYHVDPLPWLGASAIVMNTGMQSRRTSEDKTIFQQLFGAYLDIHPKNFSLQASYYRQTGREESELPIYAWMASAESAWQMNPYFKWNLGYFYMSGDTYYIPKEGQIGLIHKTEVRGFNPIFGSHHKFYGAMEFFYVSAFYGGNTPGLQDLHAGGTWTPSSKFSFTGTYHFLATGVKLPDINRDLGHEVELSLNWKIAKDVSIQAGYSFMQGTKTMERLKRSSDKNRLQWAWLMVVVTPDFFKF